VVLDLKELRGSGRMSTGMYFLGRRGEGWWCGSSGRRGWWGER
jgi:hypothetical protein